MEIFLEFDFFEFVCLIFDGFFGGEVFDVWCVEEVDDVFGVVEDVCCVVGLCDGVVVVDDVYVVVDCFGGVVVCLYVFGCVVEVECCFCVDVVWSC